MSKKIFITGTGTDVGKTYITGLIIKKLKEYGKSAAYYKAAMSGNVRDEQGKLIPGDAVFVKQMSGISQQTKDMCPYVYENAYSPHLASRIEGNPVKLDVVKAGFEKVCKDYDYITVEGSGGILCPLRYDETRLMLEDVVQLLQLPVLIVADAKLGSINAAGLTVAYLRQKEIPISGIILNRFQAGDAMEEDNRQMIVELTGVPVLDTVGEGEQALHLTAEEILALYA